MSEFRSGTKLLLAVALCVSMVTSMLVLVPHKAEAAPQDGWIEGTVSDGVDPIPDVLLIYILNMGGGGNPLGSGLTDSFGHYNLTVVGGLSYIVLAFEGNYYSNSSAATVVSGETSIANVIMTPITPAVADVTLRGFVKIEGTGSPVTVGSIIGYTNDPLMTEGGPPYYGNLTAPDGLGEYSVNVIAGAAGGGVGIMGVPGYGFAENSTSNPFVSGMTYWLNISLGQSVSTDDAVIHGNVTDDSTGLSLGGVLVNFDSSNEWNRNRSYSNYTFTDLQGHYKMNVTNGTSNIMFSKSGYAIFRLSEMSVSHGANLRINASLLPLTATVNGNVTDASLAPIVNAQVFVFDETHNNISYAVTNSLGKFTFDVFDGDNLSFGAQASGYGSDWTVIDILPGDSIWHDFVLPSFDAWMTGKVTNELNGSPIENAHVDAHSSIFGASGQTNSMGDYNISLVSGTTYTVNVDAMGYGHNSSEVAVATGENVYNVELMPLDAWMTGKVTDRLSGFPIENASVWVHSSVFQNWNATDSAGDYNVTLVSGTTYTVDVDAAGYRHDTRELAVVSGENLCDVQLLLSNLPQTTKLYGWVNDSNSLSGIADAQVRVGFLPPDYGGQNQTMTNGTGYYEMWVSPVELMYVVSAPDHVHAQEIVNATGEAMVRRDVLLDLDIWSPNVTSYDQSPSLNISWTNPSLVHAVVQEQDPSQFILAYAIYDHTTGIHSYFYIVQMLYDSFNPLNYASNDLPYTQAGDAYTIDYNWIGTAHGGLLTNMTDQEYLGSYEVTMDLHVYDGIRGYYTNSTLGGWMSGSALFDRSTGDFAWFQFEGSMPWADPSDPTGVFQPSVSMIEVDETNGNSNWYGDWHLGDWSVAGLEFAYDELLPSGRYVSQFFVSDFGQRGWGQLTNLTVDNDPPVADWGSDRQAIQNITIYLDGGNCSDNVGIVDYEWSFWDDGTYYDIHGAVVTFAFTELGDHNVTLTVTDGAGHVSSANVVLTVIPDPPPVANAGPDQLVLPGTVVFDASGSWDVGGGIVNVTWTFTYDGNVQTLWGWMPTFDFLIEGVYDVTLTVTDSVGQTSTDHVQITVSATIPEFPTMLLPVMGILALFALVCVRRRFEEG
jgi:hypothetical protein